MYREDSAALSFGAGRLWGALVCAGLSVAMARSGFLSFLFLVPLGWAAAVYSSAAAWAACAAALLVNCVTALVFSLYAKTGMPESLLQTLYFSVMALGITWIMAGARRIRTAYRFCSAAAAGGLVLLCITFGTNSEFTAALSSQAELLSSLYIASSGADAVKRSFLEKALTPDMVIRTLRLIALRGGALVSAFFMFFVNRQLAIGGAWLFKKRRPPQNLLGFHVPSGAIWVLSLSLAAILLSRFARREIPEIIAWNILVLCGILFLAQGAGIVLFVLGRRALPALPRLALQVLIIVVILSPGINTAALGALVLLGIAENWLPLRAAPKQENI
jgi:hypothetical protein